MSIGASGSEMGSHLVSNTHSFMDKPYHVGTSGQINGDST
jgi:hypothetical protein